MATARCSSRRETCTGETRRRLLVPQSLLGTVVAEVLWFVSFRDESCSNYFMNFTVADAGNHTLDVIAATLEKDGVASDLNQSIQIDFYESCSECLMVVYTSPAGRYLLNYKREGRHRDVEEMTSHHNAHERLAKCLRISHDQHFSYDGAADFCHRKSSPAADDAAAPVLPE